MQSTEKRDVQMICTTHTRKGWLLFALMISWIYLASRLFQRASSEVLKFTLLGGVPVITEALIGISIAMGEVFPFALGLAFFGTRNALSLEQGTDVLVTRSAQPWLPASRDHGAPLAYELDWQLAWKLLPVRR
jgi:hypothetical protein